MRRRWLWLGLFLGCIAPLSWMGLRLVEQRSSFRELDEAKKDIEAGRQTTARQRLLPLTQSSRFRDEAFFQLGLCEEARGERVHALAAWEHIAASSPFGLKSVIARARVLANFGQFSQAEDLLGSVPWRSDAGKEKVRQALKLMLLIQGRKGEVLPLILETWEESPDPAEVLRQMYLLENSASPIGYIRSVLELGDPADDRIWLAKASLATWTGEFDEAARWLDRCTKRRPEDRAVWRALLELAIAAEDLDGFQRAASHLTAAEFNPVELLRLRVWVIARLGDARRERAALLALVEQDPSNIGAWDRLAELALKEGQLREAEGYRKRKAEMNTDRERYKNLIEGDELSRHAEELERLSERLGRRLEARGWSLIRQGRVSSGLLPLDTERPFPPLIQGQRLAATLAGGLPPASSGSPSTIPRLNTPSPEFTDDANAAGLRFIHENGHSVFRDPPPPEAMCGGVALLDYDGDGWLDVYVVQGGPFPPSEGPSHDGDRLFRNRRDGTFEDITERAGIAALCRGYGHGVAVADYNNDGRPDLFVTRWRSYALYRNKGDGTFEDVTHKAGLDGDRDWPTSAAWADLDGDGDLDLYVCHYLLFDPTKPKRCEHPKTPGSHFCDPLDFPALADHVFRNDGGRFVDVTAEAGFIDPDGRGLGVVAADLDDDNRIDLYVANDMTANYLFHNLGGFRFDETGQTSGTAASADGGFKAGMGVACGDLDGDGRPDLAVTNFFGESTTFYCNLGRGLFADHTNIIGLAAPTRQLLGFGIAFVDVNNDCWLDVLSANGHVLDARPKYPCAMPLQLLLGSPGGRLTDVSETAGAPFHPLHLGRGLAVGDIDNDGRLDAVIVVQNEPLVYLHNSTRSARHFIRFRLEGTKSNRDGIGARIMIACAGQKQVQQRIGGSSYQSSSDPRIHFGLGASSEIDYVEVRWPSGRIDRHAALPADREYLIRER